MFHVHEAMLFLSLLRNLKQKIVEMNYTVYSSARF